MHVKQTGGKMVFEKYVNISSNMIFLKIGKHLTYTYFNKKKTLKNTT